MLGEEKDQRAGLAGVGGGKVEVEDCADAGRDGAVVLRAEGFVGLSGVDGDDEVGVLVFAVEVRWAAGTGCGGWRGG